MSFQISGNTVLYVLAACLAFALAWVAWKRRRARGGWPLALLMMAVAVWLLATGFEGVTSKQANRLFWMLVGYLGALTSPLFLFLFALEYTCLDRRLNWRHLVLLALLPALTLLLMVTNPWHRLVWADAWPGLDGSKAAAGPVFWVGVVGYSHLLMAGATLCLVRNFLAQPGDSPARQRFRALLVAVLVPWAGLLLSGLNLSLPAGLTPLLILASGSFLSHTVLHLRLFDPIPFARTTLVDTMPDGVIVLDKHGNILDLNAAARRLFGLTDIPYAEHIARFLPAWATLNPLLDAGRLQVEVSLNAQPYELDIAPLVGAGEGGAGWLIVVRNIELRRRTERALQRRDAILRAVSLAAEKFLRLEDWEQSIPAVLEQIGQAAQVSRVYIFERNLNEEGVPLVSQRYEWTAPGFIPQIDNPALQNFPYTLEGFARWEASFLENRPVVGLVRDFPASEQAFLAEQDILSIAVVPIFVEGGLWGFIGFDDCVQERAWSEAELEALKAAADIFGAAIARHRALAALRNRERALTLLHDILQAALQASDLRQTAQILVNRLGEIIGADGCFLTLWDDENQRTIPLAAYGAFQDTYPTISVGPRCKTLTASVLKAGHTLVIPDTMNSPYVSRRIARRFPTRSMLAIPLIAGQMKVGALLLPFDRKHQFSQEEIAISEQAGKLVALTLAKLLVAEEASRRADETETLRKAGAAVTAALDVHEAVHLILDQLQLVVPHDSASVQLLRDGYLEIVGGRGWPDPSQVVGLRFPVPGDNPNTIVIETRQAYILNAADRVYPMFRQPPHNHIRSWLGVPLVIRQRVIGLLAIDSSQPNHFTPAHARLASAFADQVAIALENARLFSEVQELARTDALTGLYNRRGLLEVGQIEFLRARRFQRPFCAILVDIDHFKRINDRYGHTLGGDPALKALAQQLLHHVREIDLVGRYGGEEFVVLLPETDLTGCYQVAERLRQAVQEMKIETPVGVLQLTISLGVAICDESTPTLEMLIARADDAMYIAKRKGRNRVVVATPGAGR